jgi:hypothetical protein
VKQSWLRKQIVSDIYLASEKEGRNLKMWTGIFKPHCSDAALRTGYLRTVPMATVTRRRRELPTLHVGAEAFNRSISWRITGLKFGNVGEITVEVSISHSQCSISSSLYHILFHSCNLTDPRQKPFVF